MKMTEAMDEDLDKGAFERVDKDLEAGIEAYYAMMAEENLSKKQSRFRRGDPIGNQQKHVPQIQSTNNRTKLPLGLLTESYRQM